MDVAAWLRGLGLEQYEPAFRDNRVDSEILPKLTAEDLKDIGVAMVGDRRKLLARSCTPASRQFWSGILRTSPSASRNCSPDT
jgi:hypothetical protein